MTPDRWQRLERLYHAARERPAAERAAFLAEACGADTALRHDLESLLCQDETDGFLDTPVPHAAESQASLNRSAVAAFPGGSLRGYEIQGRIGAGGMGEVYRARDTTLGRDVAIKVLPRSLSDDADRRARFEREARLLAALNHPHIAQIYGFEEFDGGRALVMELVEGDTLGEMIARAGKQRPGALPIATALGLARQMADALDGAHSKGIVHRDLKPSNVKVTPAGNVKVLDFGLAKAVDPAVAAAAMATEVSRHPVIVGTVPYVSPEQASGEPVDKRSDIWAFGCVLFEMLTGRPPFEGDGVSDTLSRILGREPDWAGLPAATPPAVRRLLERCLRKDPSRRLHDIADARIELEDVEQPAGVAKGSTRSGASRRERFAWILSVALVASLFLTVMFYRSTAPVRDELSEFSIDPPTRWTAENNELAREFSISPDGRQVTVAARSGDTSYLWVRSIASSSWRQLGGTEGAVDPFWKPDSQSIGFFVVTGKGQAAVLKLKTIRISDGVPFVVCELPANRPPFAAWSSGGVIVFSHEPFLEKVSDRGGTPIPATTRVDQSEVHRSPSFLPDGVHFLYLAQGRTSQGTTRELRVGTLSSASATESLGSFDSNAVYSSGYLLSVREDRRLTAQPFDVASRRLADSAPQTLAENVALNTTWRRAQFSVSATGRLTYSQAVKVESELVLFDRAHRRLASLGARGNYSNLNLNHDDTRLLVTRTTQSAGEDSNVDIWVIDLARSGATRLTFEATAEYDPAWSHDEKGIVFGSIDQKTVSGRDANLFLRSSDGAGGNTLLFHAPAKFNTPAELSTPEYSPDGRFLMFTQGIRDGSGSSRRALLTIESGADHRNPKPFLHANGSAGNGAFSPPDGRWVAYEVDDSGQYEIFVAPFPRGDKRIPISTDGGTAPRWRGDGKELFFLALDGKLMAVDIDPATGGPIGLPKTLFPTGLLRQGFDMHPYVVTKDGQRFLMAVPVDPGGAQALRAIWDWPAKLHK
jgi:serine/threonine protein kinase